MLRFILNDALIETTLPAGSTVLDFVRYHKRLTGTKIGCREGDCGACTILVGTIEDNKLSYQSATSCLMPMINAAGKHIVTVEGINGKSLTSVQQALVDTNGTQCGFCTVGFVMALTGYVLDECTKGYTDAVKAIDGNICRCTGYKSIEKAAKVLSDKMEEKPKTSQLQWLIENNFIPAYFSDIKNRLQALNNVKSENTRNESGLIIGGGTDLIVQKHLLVKKSETRNFFDFEQIKQIKVEYGICSLGASVTVTAFAQSELIQGIFPGLHKYIKLISSSPIRNMATIAGNLVNASPIGDMTVFLLALDASIILSNGNIKRELKLKDFYKGYKQLDRNPDEYIETISFNVPEKKAIYNFEKVSKRTHLDIASVNSACLVATADDGSIKEIHLSAGGVAPFPKYLAQTCEFLKGKKPGAEILQKAIGIINSEVVPISDARGAKEYKLLLLRQLFLAHFAKDEKLIKETISIG